MEAEDVRNAIADCVRLHIYSKPDVNSEVVCKVRYLTDLIIDLPRSTEDFYMVWTPTGAYGYCRKDQILTTW